jgi:hypothetical protein
MSERKSERVDIRLRNAKGARKRKSAMTSPTKKRSACLPTIVTEDPDSCKALTLEAEKTITRPRMEIKMVGNATP